MTTATATASADAGRRRALRWLGGAGLGLLATARRVSAAAPAGVDAVPACPRVATETAGPFPADGSRPGFGGPPPPGFGPMAGRGPGRASGERLGFGPDGGLPPGPPPAGWPPGPPPGAPGTGPGPGGAPDTAAPVDVVEAGLVRADIRANTDGRNPQPGVPLDLAVTVRDAQGCAPLAGVYVYVWHCSRDGHYSGYAGATDGSDFLRGVQRTDAQGRVRFTTVYPGRYEGRATHLHAAVFPATAAPAFDPATKRSTTQFALPDETSAAVYAQAPGYAANRRRGVFSNAADGIFADGTGTELLAVAGDPASGLSATITINV